MVKLCAGARRRRGRGGGRTGARRAYIPPPGYWQAVREACRAHGTLLIFDEIPTGLGKTGRFFAAEHDGAVPDIVVLGKALGGGVLPIAACLARDELNVAGAYALGHYTHEKNPVTAAAALATLDVIERDDLVENAARVGAHALQRLHEMKAATGSSATCAAVACCWAGPGARPRQQGAGPPPPSGAVPRAAPRAVVQDDDGQRADADAAAHVTLAQMDQALDIVDDGLLVAARGR
jgi:hypothetical protein